MKDIIYEDCPVARFCSLPDLVTTGLCNIVRAGTSKDLPNFERLLGAGVPYGTYSKQAVFLAATAGRYIKTESPIVPLSGCSALDLCRIEVVGFASRYWRDKTAGCWGNNAFEDLKK